MIINPVVALNLAPIFIKPLAIKGRLLNRCHLLNESNGDIFVQQQGKPDFFGFRYWGFGFFCNLSNAPAEPDIGRIEVEKKIRILVAKPGLDGHDRGAKVVAQALRDAGMEVIYTGLHQTVDQIINTAIQEDVDVIGLSIMSGAHLPICEKLMKKMREKKIEDILLVVGGVIPKRDFPSLQRIGIQGIFPGGTPFGESIRWIKEHVKPY